MGGKLMFRRIRRLKDIIEIQIFSIMIAGAVIVREKWDRNKKDENPFK
tara:strand:+ start:85 stop:228 length:144 start_codon:yes stop_codon:yes gene_type:complete